MEREGLGIEVSRVPWTRKHVIGLADWSREEIQAVLELARYYKESLRRTPATVSDTLRGCTVLNLFFEPSTRTRMSFELAGLRLGARVVNFDREFSSLLKGESLRDTIRTLNAYQVDAMIIRHSLTGAPLMATGHTTASVINAGDGMHEHPTQGLLDLFTIMEQKGRIEGLHVVIVGDVLHSRVVRSDLHGLITMGARVSLVGPPPLVPPYFRDLGAEIHHYLDPVLPEADILCVLRIQRERQQKAYIPSLAEYTELYRITEERLSRARPGVLVMHPGPMNRDVEISAAVADSHRSLVLDQVTNGIAVRMALLHLLLRGEPDWVAS